MPVETKLLLSSIATVFSLVIIVGCSTVRRLAPLSPGESSVSLDPFLFNGEKVSAYSFDSCTGQRECGDVLDSIKALELLGAVVNEFASENIHQFALTSGANQIAAVLVARDTLFGPADTVIVYFHGKSQNLDYYWPRVRLLFASGYPVFVIDYQGFGASTGSTTEQGLFDNTRTACFVLWEPWKIIQ